MTDRQSTPLNAEEEASLRLSFGQGRITGEPPYYFETICRLLATLDAARERPSALDVEVEVESAISAVRDRVAAMRLHGTWTIRKRDVLDIIDEERERAATEYARPTEPDAGEKFSGWMDPADCADCTPDTTEAALERLQRQVAQLPLWSPHPDVADRVGGRSARLVKESDVLDLLRAALQQPAVQPERRRGAGQRGFPLRDDEGAAPAAQPEGGPE